MSDSLFAGGVRPDSIGSAIVVGGGLAGLTAALRLAERGVRVDLFETRTKLGGRATSFDDVRTGARIDNCQHVALGCCTNYRALLDRLGIGHLVRWHSHIDWLEPGGARSTTRSSLLPAPIHGAPSLLSARFLPMKDRLSLGQAMLLALSEDRHALPPVSFSRWLDVAEQSDMLRRRFWDPLIISACNTTVDRVDQAVALHVVQEGMLATRWSGAIGVPLVPLTDLYAPVQRRIEALGGKVHLSSSVQCVRDRHIETRDGTVYRADCVICAVPFERVGSLLGPDHIAADPALQKLERLMHSPILGVHLVFDRPVLSMPLAVLLDQGTQWVFRKDEEGRVVHAVISAADDWVALDESTIVQRVIRDMQACIPSVSYAGLQSARAVKEKRATFLPSPESRALRPSVRTNSGVLLAGCYTDTGWPSTMEGAVRSGDRAAATALGFHADHFLKPSLRPALLCRMLGLRA